MSRVFLMKWYHFSVEYFEDLRNVNHCEFLIMRKQESGKYLLETKLRTWSELRRERAAQKEKERQERARELEQNSVDGGRPSKDASKLERASSIVVPRRWGGCPNGCDHGKHFKIRSDLAELVRTSDQLSAQASKVVAIEATEIATAKVTLAAAVVPSSSSATVSVNTDNESTSTTPALETGITTPATTVIPATPILGSDSAAQTIISRRPAHKRFQSFISDAGQEYGDTDGDVDSSELDDPRQRLTHGPRIDVMRAREEIVSSPDGTPSYISPETRVGALTSPPAANGIMLKTTGMKNRLDASRLCHDSDELPAMHLHLGRDFGGTYSGHASQAGSSDEDKPAAASSTRVVNGAGPPKARGSLGIAKMKEHAAARADESSSEESGMACGAKACRLGDAPHSSDADVDADADDEGDDELTQAEKEEQSIQGSIY